MSAAAAVEAVPVEAPVTYIEAPTYVTMPEGVQYVDEAGNPVQVVYQAPAPTVYNISPEKFALLASGGSLTQEEISELMSTGPVVPGTVTTIPTLASTEASPVSGKKGSKKAMKASKKKKKGCC